MNPVPPISTFAISAPETGTEYRIYVVGPDVASQPGPWPAVIFLDGDDQFRFAVEGYQAARTRGLIPPLWLVGVGYGAGYTKPGNRRLRDYTPTPLATEPDSGGAEAFRAFLGGTLWRELAARHPIRDDQRGIGGHSLGSLLVLDALFQREPRFSRFLASAPSLWWDDRALLGHADRLQRTGAALPARLFLAVGENDTPSMTGDLEMLERQLAARPFPQLEVISRRFLRRDHYTVLPEAFSEGLQALYAGGK
jgi:hypothetical protein